MEDTNIFCQSLAQLDYDSKYYITDQGVIIDTALQIELQPYKNQSYKLTKKDGKTVIRAIKPLYREIFGKEYAEDRIADLKGEEWHIIDSKGKYYVSNRGRVKSYQGREAKLLKPYTNQRGYLRVDVKSGCRRTYLVHQLVALAFIPNDNPIEKDTVDHIDGDKTNNSVENLRWLSRADNARAYREQKKEQGQNDGQQSKSKDDTN